MWPSSHHHAYFSPSLPVSLLPVLGDLGTRTNPSKAFHPGKWWHSSSPHLAFGPHPFHNNGSLVKLRTKVWWSTKCHCFPPARIWMWKRYIPKKAKEWLNFGWLALLIYKTATKSLVLFTHQFSVLIKSWWQKCLAVRYFLHIYQHL